MNQNFKNIFSFSNKEKIYWLPVVGYCILQFLLIIYLNIGQMPYFTGYDASAYYVLAHEMVSQKTMMVDNFVFNTTTMLWDSPLLIAAFFHLFLDDIFLCYGLANVLTAVFLIYTLFLFCDALGASWKGKLIALIFLLTPYVSNYYTYNDLGYFSMLFISMGAYAWRLPCILWVYILFLDWDARGFTKKNYLKFMFGLGFIILNSISSGSFILVFGIAPLLLFVLVRGLVEDKWWGIHNNVNIFVGIILLSSVFSQLFTRFVLKFQYLDTSSSWISLHHLFENIQNLVLGFLELLGAIPLHSQVSVFGIQGILYGMRLFVTIVLVSGVVYELWAGIKEKTSYQLMTCFLLSHILIFSLLDTRYGATIFEIRYLIFAVVVMFSLFGCWVQRISTLKNKSFRYFLTATLGLSMVSIQVSSFYALQDEKTDYDALTTVAEYLAGYEDTLVYFAGESEYFSVFAANMRAVDFNKVYKYSPDLKNIYHCADYNYYDDNGAYEGGSFLITVPWMFSELDEVFRHSYELIHSFPEIEIYIYYADENPVDLASGIGNHPVSRDFSYSAGVVLDKTLGVYTEMGDLSSNGVEGVLCYNTFMINNTGIIDFTTFYEGISGNETLGMFQLLVDGQVISSTPLLLHSQSAEIPAVDLIEMLGEELTYQIVLEEGSEIIVKSFEMKRQ